MRMRVCAVALPTVRLELARAQGAPPGPLALVVARPGGAVQDERSILGNTRLDVVSPEAARYGIQTGSTVAAARARYAHLAIRVVEEDAIRDRLGSLAEVLLAFGPTTSFDLKTDLLWVDISGCGHFFRTSQDPTGEYGLADKISEQVQAMGHKCRLAIGTGPRLIGILARYGSRPRLILSTQEQKIHIAKLPLVALPVDPRLIQKFQRLGLNTWGDLARLPRAELSHRLRDAAPQTLELLEGKDTSPLTPYDPPEIPTQKLDLDYGVASTEALIFILKRLIDPLALRLSSRGLGATQWRLQLRLERMGPEQGPQDVTLELACPAPLAEPRRILELFRVKLERWQLIAPARKVILQAVATGRLAGPNGDFFYPEARSTQYLAPLVGELMADLGPEQVGTLSVLDSWDPDARSRLIPFGAPRPTPARPHPLVGQAVEPLRKLPAQRLAPIHLLAQLNRTEYLEWWRQPSVAKDLYAAWLPNYGAVGWVQAQELLGWIDG